MPRWLIERNMPGVGDFTTSELQAISGRSCEVLAGMPSIQWVEAFVTADKLYCVMFAPSEEAVREHAVRAGFPVDSVHRVGQVIDPTTAERTGLQSGTSFA